MLGGEQEFRALADAARGAGLGIVLDIVPNHMAVDDANRYWADPTLRRKFFDIDAATGRHRRFFDIDHLAGVRQEDPEVFEETHGLALALVREGLVDGLRIDHPDGLADPAGYLRAAARRRRRARVGGEDPRPGRAAARLAGVGHGRLRVPQRRRRRCSSTPPARRRSPSCGRRSRATRARSRRLRCEAKLEQARGTFAPEVERLGRELRREPPRRPRAGRGVAARLPHLRGAVRRAWSTDADREAIAEAGHGRTSWPRILLLEEPAPPEFVTRFQQTTPAVMAKGVEDTAFYRYARLLALNDVGGDPGALRRSTSTTSTRRTPSAPSASRWAC